MNASSEAGRTVVNGMSYRSRDSANANSAVIVNVAPEDFDGTDALAGRPFPAPVGGSVLCGCGHGKQNSGAAL